MSLSGKTMFISGASRGIGLEIAKRAAADGANIALIAKTAEPHPKLPGTVYTAAKELEEAGGQALPIVGDIRDEESVASAVAQTVEQFGGIDMCVNNASAINLGSIKEVPLKRFDLMNGIQVRGTYTVSQACIPHMVGRENPHILTLSPPVRLEPEWLKPTAYMMAKYGMSLCALAMAEELREDGIASNTLWPRTLVATAAVQNLLGGDEAMARARKPDVYADAAYVVLTKPAREYTGNSLAVRGRAARVRRHRPFGLRLRARLGAGRGPVGRHPEPAGLQRALIEFDDAADVSTFPHIGDGLVDLIEPIAPGHQLVEFEVAVAVHRQQHWHARAGVHAAVPEPFELLAGLDHVDEYQRDQIHFQLRDRGHQAGAALAVNAIAGASNSA